MSTIIRPKLLHLQWKITQTYDNTPIHSLLGIAVVLLGVKALFVKGGQFPSGHAHDNSELRRRGVGCHRDM